MRLVAFIYARPISMDNRRRMRKISPKSIGAPLIFPFSVLATPRRLELVQ